MLKFQEECGIIVQKGKVQAVICRSVVMASAETAFSAALRNI